MDHAGHHVVVVSFDTIIFSPAVEVAIESFLVRLWFRVFFRANISSIQFAQQTSILMSNVVDHFIFDLLSACGESLKVGLLLVLILIPTCSERV